MKEVAGHPVVLECLEGETLNDNEGIVGYEPLMTVTIEGAPWKARFHLHATADEVALAALSAL